MCGAVKRESLIGLPVICSKNGKKLGIITDILFTPGKKKIEGVKVVDKGRRKKAFTIPLEKIKLFGEVAVIVEDEASTTDSKGVDILVNQKRQEVNNVLGRPIIRDDGQELGVVSDIVFDPSNGNVEGYEVSKGFIDDLIEGRSILPYDSLNPASEDVIIVSVEQTDNIQSNNRGIKNLFLRKLE